MLIEAYDQPWKRQLEGTVGGYWGLVRFGEARSEIPAGRRHQQLSRLEMAAGLRDGLKLSHFRRGLADAAAAAVDAAAGVWIAVGVAATTAGILLGIATDKMLYESYGIGGWNQVGGAAGGGEWRRRCCVRMR